MSSEDFETKRFEASSADNEPSEASNGSDVRSHSNISSTNESPQPPREGVDYEDETEQHPKLEKISSRSSRRESIRQISRILSTASRDQFEPTKRTTTGDSTGKTIISFNCDDPNNPNNWPMGKKLFCLFVAVLTVMNSTISSTLAAGATEELRTHFHITSDTLLVLPTSIFLAGYIVGPFLWGPLSESYGRRWVMITAFFIFSVFSAASAGASSFASLIVFRLFVGLSGSCPIAVVGGICADVYQNAASRGKAMAIFMASTTFGPVLGPIISGFIAVVSWRWAFGCGALLAAISWIPLALYPETYPPVLLARHARKLRREIGNPDITAPIELEKTNIAHIIQVVLTRPVRMVISEPIVSLSCLYLSVAYAMFYIFFESYPIIFGNTYHFNAGEQGLAFIPIGIGAVLAGGMYLCYDEYLHSAQKRNASWAYDEEYRRLPLACIAGPFFVLSFFWAGWTADPPNGHPAHWLSPVAAGVPFGIGYLLLFMALLNYLVDAYGIFAASASAAALTTRSTFGAVLPFAATPMYQKLGVNWACTLLGLLAAALSVVPFVFIKFGGRIRARSPFCQYLAQKRAEEEEKRRRREERSKGETRKDEEEGFAMQ